MNFSKRLKPASRESIFAEQDYFVWCGTMFKWEDTYYMVYSRWEKRLGFDAWVTDSQLCLAKGTDLFGTFEHVKVLFDYTANDGKKLVLHNPTALVVQDRIYLYFMMNVGTGDWWEHRNNQRIGVAYTDSPEGEWVRLPEPVIDVSCEGIDSLMVSNPTVLQRDTGEILMVYKAVSKNGEMPVGGAVICGVAQADSPLGKFEKYGKPVFVNPENAWSVEDPYIWNENGTYYAIVKDFNGYFTGTKQCSTALFCSDDGYDWRPGDCPLAYENKIIYTDGEEAVYKLERPQLLIENGHPVALVCACLPTKGSESSFNIRIPLE